MYSYELFKLQPNEVERLKESESPENLCLLGRWYIYTAPEEGYEKKAFDCFSRAAFMGNADAKLHLANIYRLGDLGRVDMEAYRRLLVEAIEDGCQLAEIRLCKDIAYGVGQKEDLDKGLEEAKRRLAAQKNPDPRWYDTIGWMLFAKEETKTANEWFLKAIDCGYADSYMGLSDMPELYEEGRRKGCGGCCIMMADDLKLKYDECGRNDANAVEYFSEDYEKRAYLDANYKYRVELAAQIEALYEEGEKLGEPSAYFYHGMLYYNAEYNHMEDDDKAWACFMRGNQQGCVSCISMLYEMIMEGRAPEQYQYEDACFFSLKALRYGDDDMLLPVMHAYFEGDLNEYADEIESLYKPRYDALEYDADGLENWPDDDPEDDDGRFDAWA